MILNVRNYTCLLAIISPFRVVHFLTFKISCMKQLLLTAGACIGLFAFTRVGGSQKPDSIRSVSFVQAAQMDTTKKPKPDSVRATAFLGAAQMDTTKKPKPDSLMLAMR